VVRVPECEFRVQPGGLFVGEVFGADLQAPADFGGSRPSPNWRVWLRTRHHRPAADHRRRLPRKAPLRSSIRRTDRREPDPGVIGKNEPSPDRAGHRQANSALYHIVIVRLRYDQATRDYAARRTAEGKTKMEIVRVYELSTKPARGPRPARNLRRGFEERKPIAR
jgi:hypothetical protein